jgi:hypothetical protein
MDRLVWTMADFEAKFNKMRDLRDRLEGLLNTASFIEKDFLHWLDATHEAVEPLRSVLSSLNDSKWIDTDPQI